MAKAKHNDEERRQWVLNDEGLYDWYRGTRMTVTAFIKAHRKEIDEVIDNVNSGARRQHYLKYGG